MRRAALAVALVLAGCPSAYDRTYQQTTERLEGQARADRAQQEQQHAQAQRYAAVAYFATGSAALTPDAERELRWFVQQMQPYPQASFNVQGFTDSTGSESGNTALAQQRAQAVADYLASLGIDRTRLAVTGFGQDYAAASNVTAAGRRDNRRVEVTVR